MTSFPEIHSTSYRREHQRSGYNMPTAVFESVSCEQKSN
jgi:hypothetical protein